jgi:hypothetical protein
MYLFIQLVFLFLERQGQRIWPEQEMRLMEDFCEWMTNPHRSPLQIEGAGTASKFRVSDRHFSNAMTIRYVRAFV